MILFTILLCLLFVVTAIALVASVIAGAGVLVIFGDLVVFGLIMWWLIKLFRKDKK